MNLLGAKLYDPAAAVTKNTTAALAMTALDTTNLRLAITVPAHGMVRFRLAGCIHGATTFPSVLLGVMNGASVLGRVAPVQSLGNTAVATALVNIEADFIVTGLTPGAMNVDAAYGVETLVASTGIKYGGPNNTTANDAFGGFAFEAWDPQPITANATLAVDSNGRVDVSKVSGTAQTAGDIIARLPAALVGGRMDSSVGAMANSVITAAAHAAGAIDANAIAANAITSSEAPALANLDAAVSTRLAAAGYTAPLDAAGTRGALGMASANLDTQLAAIVTAIATRAAPGDQMALTAAAIDAILDDPVEGATTLRQLQRLFAAALLGKVSGMGGNVPKFRDLADTKDRISATTDANGNRTMVTLDAS